jgi:hypothetical protein
MCCIECVQLIVAIGCWVLIVPGAIGKAGSIAWLDVPGLFPYDQARN